jgi:hypothetical protein
MRTMILHFNPTDLDSHQGDASRMIGFLCGLHWNLFDSLEIAMVNTKEVQALYKKTGSKAQRLVTMRYENKIWTSAK